MLGCTPIKSKSPRRRPRHEYFYFLSSPQDSCVQLRLRTCGLPPSILGASEPPEGKDSDSVVYGCFPSAHPSAQHERYLLNECIHKLRVWSRCCFTVPLFSSRVQVRASHHPHPKPLDGWHFPKQKKQLVATQGPKPS